MFFFKMALMIGLALFSSTAEVRAAEVMLKIACIETSALDAFRGSRTQSSEGTPAIEYSAVAFVLTHSISAAADAGQKASINSNQLMQVVVRDIPAALQGLYPEQARLIGRQMPEGSNGWHKFLIECSSNAPAFVELSVEHAVLDRLATGFEVGSLHERPIKQYAQGSSPDIDAVFTAGYSFFSQQLAQGNAREWLETIMPLKSGLGVLALRRAGTETRTDTIIIRIDARNLPHSLSARTEVLVVLGWDRLQ